MTTPQTISEALGGVRAGAGFLCRCPAHDDQHRSLSVGPGKLQAIVLNCKAGCPQNNVIAALKQMKLWVSSNGNGSSECRVINATSTEPEWAALMPVPDDAPPPPVTHPKHGPFTTRYTYRDADSNPILYIDRFDHPNGKKDFCPLTFATYLAERKWLRRIIQKPNPLYNLHLLSQSPSLPVLIVEGEKCADAANAIMDTHITVTWPGGSNNVHNVDLAPLAGRPVIIWPDNDQAGSGATRAIATLLKPIASSISIVQIPDGKPSHWDIADADPKEARALVAAAETPANNDEDTIDAAASELHFTDLGNSERLVMRYGDDLLYCYQTASWFIWNGRRWLPDDGAQVCVLMQKTVRSMWREISHVDDQDRRTKLAKHAHTSESRNKIEAAVTLARSMKPISIETFDRNEMELNCANGIVDMATGALSDHSRTALLTKFISTNYDPKATCPTWMQFLTRIMGGNFDLVNFLQRAIGYSLTGSTQEQCLFIMHGSGQNGKSTFLQTLKLVFGDYARQADAATFMASKFESRGPRPDLVALRGARFVPAVEVEEGQRFAESLVKTLTGQDTISTRDLYGKQFEFVPQFKLWIAANHKPVIRGQDSGIWRRIRLIPFNVQIPPEERDVNLLGKLLAEAPGVLAWAIRGAVLWQQQGLGVPPEVEEATSSYRNECDRLASFLSDYCVHLPNATVRAQELYKAYQQWCEAVGERCESNNIFGRRLIERGIESERKKTGIYYIGIGLRADDSDDHLPD
jgi:putative DNA primase/helicase